MQHNDIIVLIEFDYQPAYYASSHRKTIKRFPKIEDESNCELYDRVIKWLESKDYYKMEIMNLRLIIEDDI